MRSLEAFLDIRVFNANASRYLNATLPQCREVDEKEKIRNYNKKILQIEHGTFTPLVFSLYDHMRREYAHFIQNLQNCYLINAN